MLKAVPIELKQANEFVERVHRHHKPVYRDKFRVAAYDTDKKTIVGIAQVGRPVNRNMDDGNTLEIVRLCTDGTRNACSFLYSRCHRIAKELGYKSIITYILEGEPATSLLASGFHLDGLTKGGTWDCPSRPRNQTAPICRKQRWRYYLNE